MWAFFVAKEFEHSECRSGGGQKMCHLLVARGGFVPWNPCNMVEEVQDLVREGHACSSV